jgi:hypothetical protein
MFMEWVEHYTRRKCKHITTYNVFIFTTNVCVCMCVQRYEFVTKANNDRVLELD